MKGPVALLRRKQQDSGIVAMKDSEGGKDHLGLLQLVEVDESVEKSDWGDCDEDATQ